MRLLKPKNWLLPLYLLAFVGSGVTFISPIFNTTSRWSVLAIFAVFLWFNGKLMRPLGTNFGFLTMAFAMWAFATGIWSEIPQLSYLKSFAFFLIALAGLAGGQAWVSQNKPLDGLKFLGPLAIVTLLAGLLGQTSQQAYFDIGTVGVYQGLTGNPNMFGSLLAMCTPFVVWQIYCNWAEKRKRAVWLLLVGLGFYFLIATASRASILIVLCTLLGLLLALKRSRRFFIFVLLSGFISIILLFMPQQFEKISERLIYKGQTSDAGTTFSRDEVWSESYELAVKGGVAGGGYGVTIGDSNFQGGLSAVGYGREKGNSQFAIAEETGLIGLLIYLTSLIFLLTRLGRVVIRLPCGPHKTMLAIVTGTLVGMLIQSVFEAWWVAPASPESAYFWVMAGVALALSATPRQKTTPPACTTTPNSRILQLTQKSLSMNRLD